MPPPESDPQESTDSQKFIQAGQQPQLSLAAEFWIYIKENKAWWMVPILLVLSALGALIALGSTGAAPFIYTLF